MSNYGNNPNYQNQSGSKLGKFILDPKSSVKNYLNDALVGGDTNRQPGYPGSTYPGGPGAGGPPYGNSYGNNNSNAPYGSNNNSLYGNNTNSQYNSSSHSGPNNQFGGPSGPPLSQPMPLRPASSSNLTDPSSVPHVPTPQIHSPPSQQTSLQPRPHSSMGSSRPHTPVSILGHSLGHNDNVQVGVPHNGESIQLDIAIRSDGRDRPNSAMGLQQPPAPMPAVSHQSLFPHIPQLQQLQPYVHEGPTRAPVLSSSMAPPAQMSMPQMGMQGGMQGGMPGMMPGMMGMNMMQPSPMMNMAQAAPAPKAYHRLVNDFSTLKSGYYAAKIQPGHGDLAPVIMRLSMMAQEIWTLRYSRAAEFHEHEDDHHRFVITMWKAEFEFWQDMFQDCYDPMFQQMQQMMDQQNNYAGLCGLGAAKASKKAATADGAAAPAKKKAASKTADGAAPKKKKVVKKAAA